MARIADMVAEIAAGVTGGYKKIEAGVVTGYKKIEKGAVSAFGKVMDKCVEILFTRQGETVEEAKARMNREGK